jgi:hypothetical protein
MENIDFKTIIYIVAAIVWFLYSSFNKEKKQQQKRESEGPPPISEEEVRDVVRRKQKKIKYAGSYESSDSLIEPEKPSVRLNMKKYADEKNFFELEEEGSAESELSDIVGNIDTKRMVIYSEILKRPVY